MIDPAEALLAVTGLRRVLAGKPPTKGDVGRSIDLEKELKEAVGAYLRGRRSPPPRVQELDLPSSLPEAAHGAVDGLDPQVALGYGLAAARALTYLRQLATRRRMLGLTERFASRSETERAQLRRAQAVVEDPVGVLGNLGALSDDEVQALRAVYPTLWSALGLAAGQALADHDQQPTSRQERVLGRIMGVTVTDVASIQSLYDQEQQAADGGGGGGGGQVPETTETATPFQRAAARQGDTAS